MSEVEPVAQSGTQFLLWRRLVKDKLSVDSQEAHVFCPRRGFLLESQMQSESAVGVRLKIYWPYLISTFGQHLFANGDLLCVAGTSTVHSFQPCGFQLAVVWPCVHGILPRAKFSFCHTESARVLLSQSFQVHGAERRSLQSYSLARWPHERTASPKRFGSQLLGVHLLERSFLVFFVAHGGEPIQISARFSLFLATHFSSRA